MQAYMLVHTCVFQAGGGRGLVLLAAGVGIGAGLGSAPPPPPPALPPTVTKLFIASGSSRVSPGSNDRQTASGAEQRQSTPLTLAEQRERAQLRVDRDKTRIEMLTQRLREDEQRLAEYRRVEVEQGANAQAVRMVFPPP